VVSRPAPLSPFALARGIENNGNSAVELVETRAQITLQRARGLLYADNGRFRDVGGFSHETRRRLEVSLTLYFATGRPMDLDNFSRRNAPALRMTTTAR
jgi:hypothetical protein